MSIGGIIQHMAFCRSLAHRDDGEQNQHLRKDRLQIQSGQILYLKNQGNCYPDGRDVMREKGLLQFLAPGEKKTYGVRLTMLENETQFEALKQK